MQAGPSRLGAAAPTRTLKQPMSLGVAEGSTRTGPTDAAALRRSLERRAELARRADKWMDRLMEEVVERVAFQRGLSYIHGKQYAEVEHERHLNGLCAYPPCPNPPAAPYSAARRFVVSTRRRTITETEGNADQAFCGARCRARSAWVGRTLGTEAAWIRGKVSPLQLLEELEERGEVRWGGRRGDVLERVARPADDTVTASAIEPEPAATAPAEGYAVDEAAAPPAVDEPPAPPPAVATPLPPAAAAAPPKPTARAPQALAPSLSPAPPPAGPQPVHDLIASLVISERPTPATKPLPPSLTLAAPPDPPAPAPAPAALPLPLPQARGTPPPRRAAGASSMISSSSTKLASTLLAAAKALPPGLQDESDAESSASEEDWAKDMGWGKGADVDALFDQARAARDLLDQP
ncbi:hypothetical protein Q8F55_007819 [Vanrija albida]|uniref:RNA polymerase II subunit B1 CTD phosphatase RPAP2 homolog n=1 Tax=Vanrija albida TaxID=181172 RepID=A0ABR3PUL3_9TREE